MASAAAAFGQSRRHSRLSRFGPFTRRGGSSHRRRLECVRPRHCLVEISVEPDLLCHPGPSLLHLWRWWCGFRGGTKGSFSESSRFARPQSGGVPGGGGCRVFEPPLRRLGRTRTIPLPLRHGHSGRLKSPGGYVDASHGENGRIPKGGGGGRQRSGLAQELCGVQLLLTVPSLSDVADLVRNECGRGERISRSSFMGGVRENG
mmetsp:Transcript_28704/g.52738  ORF Transcript_28704/g.52738 Transcript_28704/m.52738 type:complete len:204 (+) Transcript_28704:1057-1668(+)